MSNSGLSYIPAKAVSGAGINVVFAGDGSTSYTVTGTFIDAIKVWYPISGAGNRATRQDFSKLETLDLWLILNGMVSGIY